MLQIFYINSCADSYRANILYILKSNEASGIHDEETNARRKYISYTLDIKKHRAVFHSMRVYITHECGRVCLYIKSIRMDFVMPTTRSR